MCVVHSGMFKARICQLLLILLLLTGAQAASLVVYPFESEDPLVGTAVAQAIAEAFEAEVQVYGPAVSPTLVPPFLVDGGFYNPAAFQDDAYSLGATALLRAGSGADVVLNGSIELIDGYHVLELNLAHQDGMSTLTVQAPEGELAMLAARSTGITAHLLGLKQAPDIGPVNLSGAEGALASAIIRAGQSGRLEAVLEELEQPALKDNGYAARLRQAISSVLTGADAGDPALLATLSLNAANLDELDSARYFAQFHDASGLSAASLWQAVLLASAGDLTAAAQAFEATATWPYGLANLHAFTDASDAQVRAALPEADSAALLVYSILARSRGDAELEARVLTRLSHVDPWLAFAFERLSFIAFDRDDPLAAGQALAVAVTLQPGSDLYWTNLGWSQYLLGLLGPSEESSVRATLLAPQQLVAHYNLGLVRTVTGRLQEALTSYDTALRQDPIVNADAILDLQEALELYPREADVHYALAYLLEADGQRALAAHHYGAYARRVPEGSFTQRALARVELLSGPPPELQLPGGIALLLAGAPLDGSAQQGDPLKPMFEVYTPGEVLPTSMQLEFRLLDASGTEVLSQEHDLTLPADTVGFVIDGFFLVVPNDLPAGDYRLSATVSASEGRQVSSETGLSVTEKLDPLRAVLGYGINMQSVETGAALFGRSDLGHWQRSLAVLQQELARSAAAAEDVLPVIEAGRFQGMSGGDAFMASTEADIRDFLTWIAHPDLQDTSFVFVDTYAQWVVDGTPTDD